MSPHADAVRVGAGIAFHRSDRVQDIYGVIGSAVSAQSVAFGISMPAIIGAEDDISVAGDEVHVGDVAFSCYIYIGRDVAMIEDDNGPAVCGFFSVGHGHQRVDFESLGEIGNDVAVVVYAGVERGFNHHVAAGVVARAHGIDG